MTDVIAISFPASQDYREHIYRRVMNERSYGATAGDSFWMGYGDYDEVDQFARHRDEEESKPITVPAWRARIDKAKRDIAASNAMWSIRDAAEAISDEQFDVWFETITKGQNEYANNNG